MWHTCYVKSYFGFLVLLDSNLDNTFESVVEHGKHLHKVENNYHINEHLLFEGLPLGT